jgi:two-component system, chemotaxis family, protein-glutamate methylesterase/glutaminase
MMPTVVVVGTSLGGLAALSTLLRALPDDLAVPVAIVQHRTRSEDAALERLLGTQTRLRVIEPNDKEPLEPGCVYVAPADYHLLIEPTSLALSTAAALNYARPSIDLLFESAADAHGRGVLGVVLTGSNKDGARGCECIKARGGSVFAEDPATAHSPAMPAAAIATRSVDVVLPLPELCGRLIAACRAPLSSVGRLVQQR